MNALNSISFAPHKSLPVLGLSLALLTGCATTNSPNDPLEGYNRAMFSFNEQLDKVVVKPAARAYEFVLPDLVRTGVGNFIGNLEDPWIGLNNLLQGKAARWPVGHHALRLQFDFRPARLARYRH